MEERLAELEQVMVAATVGWLSSADDDPETLRSALRGVMAEAGAVFRTSAEAATLDARPAATWGEVMGQWDTAAAARIRAGQELGYFPDLDPEWTAFVFNRMDSAVLIEAPGKRPQKDPEPVCEAINEVWKRALHASVR